MNSHQESETQSLSSASNDDVTTDEVSGGVSGMVSVHNVKTVIYCESMGDIVTPANPTERTQNKDHMLKNGLQYPKRYRDNLAKRNTYKSIQCTATDGRSDFDAAEHTSVHIVCITNVNNSVGLNQMKNWLSIKKNKSVLNIYRKSKYDVTLI